MNRKHLSVIVTLSLIMCIFSGCSFNFHTSDTSTVTTTDADGSTTVTTTTSSFDNGEQSTQTTTETVTETETKQEEKTITYSIGVANKCGQSIKAVSLHTADGNDTGNFLPGDLLNDNVIWDCISLTTAESVRTADFTFTLEDGSELEFKDFDFSLVGNEGRICLQLIYDGDGSYTLNYHAKAEMIIKNETTVDFCELYVGESTDKEWGNNAISENIASGGTYVADFSYDSRSVQWDFRFVDANGDAIDFMNVDMTNAADPAHININIQPGEKEGEYTLEVS